MVRFYKVSAFMYSLLSALIYKFMYHRGQLYEIASERWSIVDDETKQKMARMAAAAAWGLGTIISLLY